jgi:hypothetical protein
LHAVVTLMRVSKNWNQFKLMLDIAHPKRGDTLQLPLMADFETDPVWRRDLSTPIKQRSLFETDVDESAATSDPASEPSPPVAPTDSAEKV